MQARQAVRQLLQRHHADDRREQWVGRGHPQDVVGRRFRLLVAVFREQHTVAPRLRTSETFDSIFSQSGVRVAMPTTTVPGSISAMGPCFSSPAG